MKNNFSENCRQILGECLEYFHSCHLITYLLTGLLVLYSEILSPRFYAWISQAWSILQNLRLSISRYVPCIPLINSKNKSLYPRSVSMHKLKFLGHFWWKWNDCKNYQCTNFLSEMIFFCYCDETVEWRRYLQLFCIWNPSIILYQWPI